MEKQELEQLKQRKTEKAEERESKSHRNKAVKEHKAVVNGKEHTDGSGTMTFSYKKLQIPKENIKKAKKLVETTTGLNNTFIQFIQQSAEEQGDKSIRYRHLKAFKAVLADLKKAHIALEAALVPEFRNMEVQNGNEGQHIKRESPDVVSPVENDHVDNMVDAADEVEELDKEQHEEIDEEQRVKLDDERREESFELPDGQHNEDNEQDLNSDHVSDTAMKDSQTETAETKKTIKTEVCDDGLLSAGEMSLDHDIMSVPPSVPEELFQMVESLADSSMLLQTDTISDSEKKTENNKSDGNSPDSQRPQPKVKNLIVKLTPVPVVTTCGSRLSRAKNREEKGEMQEKCKEESEEETSSPPPTRHSSRVKTTPLRKQTENMGQEESSESELEEDTKGQSKFSKKSINPKKEDGNQSRTVDSDSDEVPNILLEKAAAGRSSDEEQQNSSGKKCLFKLNNASTQGTDRASKRKRKSESSDSDLENKGKKLSKKKKQNGSDSSSSDSDQEAKSKVGTAKRRSGRKKQDGSKEEKSPEKRTADRKRSYERKHKAKSSKAASKLQSSSSEDEDVPEAEGESGEDSDVQKIKPIVEDDVIGSGRPFHQSSGNQIWNEESLVATCPASV